MLKILEITVRADFGGGPEHLYQLEQNLGEFEVYTACPRQKPYYDKFRKNSKNIIVIPQRTFSMIAFFKILTFIKRKNIDVVHSHGRGAGIYSRVLKLFLPQVCVVHTLHGIHYTEKLNLKNKFLFEIEKKLNRITDKIICVSKEEAQKGIELKLFSQKYEIIENCIDVIKFEKMSKNKEELELKYRAIYKLSDQDFLIGNISRFSYQKGLEYLLKAFSQLKIKNKKLFIIGDGEDRKKIENLIKKLKIENEVILAGFIQNPGEIIQMFNAYVTTSLWEGLPISLLEVMASKIPVVATNVVGNNSLIKHGETGLLCNSKNVESIKSMIEKIYTDNNKENYIKNASILVNKKYGIENMISKVKKIYIQKEVV